MVEETGFVVTASACSRSTGAGGAEIAVIAAVRVGRRWRAVSPAAASRGRRAGGASTGEAEKACADLTNKMGDLSLAMPNEAATAASAGWAARFCAGWSRDVARARKPTAAHAAEALSRAGKT